MQNFKSKIAYYLPLEVSGTVMAIAVASLVNGLGANVATLAFAGTWGENLGFYGYFLTREILRYKRDGTCGFWSILVKVTRNTIVEFGLSEVLDSFVIRPMAMYFCQQYLGSFFWGILAGKLVADLIFYLIASRMHDLRVKFIKD